jgi:hypothetical protein
MILADLCHPTPCHPLSTASKLLFLHARAQMIMNDAASWEDLEPRLGSPAVYVPSFKASLQAGHFVQAFIDGIFYVGRIIATSLVVANIEVTEHSDHLINDHEASQPGYIKLNWFYPKNLLNLAQLDVVETSTNIYLANNIELFQTKRFSW